MALTADKQQAWRARIEKYLNTLPVFVEALTNKHYEGDIKANATLNIVSVGEVSVGTYTGADITFDALATTGQTFAADQQKYFGFRVLKTDQQGSAVGLIDIGSKKAGEAMKRDIDAFVASLHSQITTNVYGTDAAPISVGFGINDILPSRALSQLRRKVAENNGDTSSMNIVVPIWLGDMILAQIAGRNTVGGDKALPQGVSEGLLPGIKMSGFEKIYCSNNVVNTGGAKYKVMVGTPESAITFGIAIEDIETGPLEKNFGTFVKGLAVYGGKAPFEGHMGLGTFNEGSWS
jgi:hypothetical protein